MVCMTEFRPYMNELCDVWFFHENISPLCLWCDNDLIVVTYLWQCFAYLTLSSCGDETMCSLHFGRDKGVDCDAKYVKTSYKSKQVWQSVLSFDAPPCCLFCRVEMYRIVWVLAEGWVLCLLWLEVEKRWPCNKFTFYTVCSVFKILKEDSLSSSILSGNYWTNQRLPKLVWQRYVAKSIFGVSFSFSFDFCSISSYSVFYNFANMYCISPVTCFIYWTKNPSGIGAVNYPTTYNPYTWADKRKFYSIQYIVQ